ncbi:MAG: phage major capsid protein [Rhodoglobus sp.]
MSTAVIEDTALSGAAKTLEQEIKALLDANERIAQTQFKIEGKNVYVPEDAAKDFRSNLGKAREKKTLLDDLRLGTSMVDFMSSDPESKSAAMRAAANSGQQAQAQFKEAKNLAEMFTSSEEFKSFRASGSLTMAKAWEVHGQDITKMSTKDVYGGMAGSTFTTPEGFGGRQMDPMVPRNFRRARVRDLFPVARTSANLIDFFRVLGFGTNRLDLSSSASVVADYVGGAFGLKPKSSLKFETAQAPVRTIAHWEAAHRNVLADEPQLQSTINNELLYGLRLTEDAQILNGTGTSEDLLGILNTPGIQQYKKSDSGVATDGKQDTLRRALTKVILAYYDATGIVIHPSDWEDIETDKGSDGHYSVTMNVTIGAESRLWSVPVVDSPAITEGISLVGAFGLGAQLYDRQEANIRIAEQHEDFFVRNAVVVLAEERLALACKRPESFVKVNFNT